MTTRPPEQRILRFAEQKFEDQIAHEGKGHIRACRARQGHDGVHCNFIDCVIVPPGTSIGVHTHMADNEELYVVLSGTGIMTVGTEESAVGPGDVIINPPGGTHGLRNTGPQEIRLIVVEYPVA